MTIALGETRYSEFTPGKDPFAKARKKSSIRWILAHILQGSNKIFIAIIFLMIFLAANVSSFSMVIIGTALTILLAGNIPLLTNYIIILFILGLSGPLMRIISRMMLEILAQSPTS